MKREIPTATALANMKRFVRPIAVGAWVLLMPIIINPQFIPPVGVGPGACTGPGYGLLVI